MELNPTKLTKTGKFAVWSNDEESDRGRDITRENTLFQMLYTSYPTSFTAFQSLQERKSGENQLTKGMKVGVLTYGEVIDMNLMHKIMEILEEENLLPSFSTSSLPSSHPNDLPTNHNLNQSQFSFYDLGSGSGKMLGFEIRREFRQEMSWGMADVFIQVKL
eukprot:scaffold8165_cov177-Ochromonas_danica.AAC.6